MKKHSLLIALGFIGSMLFASSCSPDEKGSVMQEEPEVPAPAPDPVPAVPDTIELKIGTSMSVQQEEFVSRSGNSRDLIGVQVNRHLSISAVPSVYASGVFDNIDDIVFKFVKGGSYEIKMTYYPNAKDIVYRYSNGTYGAPFSFLYGLKLYDLNEPVYYSGTENDNNIFYGHTGPNLPYLLWYIHQTKSDGELTQEMKRGTTPRYSGMIDYIKVDDKTNITIKLELCLMSITLEPENFTKGMLTLEMDGQGDKESNEWRFKPGDDMKCVFQIAYPADYEKLKLFYTEPNGDKYLLATKELECKYATNVVFKFSLAERADGSIGIQVPSDDTFVNEDATFDY